MKRMMLRAATVLAAVTVGLVAAGQALADPVYSGGAGFSGTPQVGETETAHPGTWTYSGSISFSYAWLRNGATVGTDSTYALQTADAGQTISLVVTATDATATKSANVASSTVAWPGPRNNVLPSIKGNPKPGQTMTADPGGWYLVYPQQPGPISYVYNWFLFYPNGGEGYYVSGPTAMMPSDAPPGTRLVVQVNATSPDGLGGNASYSSVMAYVDVPANPTAPPPPALTASSSVKNGDVLSGTVHWTVQASGNAANAKFYADNVMLKEVDSDGNNWAYDLDTTKLSDGAHTVGYDIYDSAGHNVVNGPSISVTIKNAKVVVPKPTPPPDGTVPSQPGSQTPPPISVPSKPVQVQPTPTPIKPPVIVKGAKAKLLGGGYAQTKAPPGGQFAVALIVIRSDNGKRLNAGVVTCSIDVKGARLVWHGWYKKAAGCRWKLPAKASGVAHGSMVVKASGLSVKRTFSVRVRK